MCSDCMCLSSIKYKLPIGPSHLICLHNYSCRQKEKVLHIWYCVFSFSTLIIINPPSLIPISPLSSSLLSCLFPSLFPLSPSLFPLSSSLFPLSPSLFPLPGVHTALQHDTIMSSGDPDYVLVEAEAKKVAQSAARAMRQSRQHCMVAGRWGRPTWTGQHGMIGVPPPR